MMTGEEILLTGILVATVLVIGWLLIINYRANRKEREHANSFPHSRMPTVSASVANARAQRESRNTRNQYNNEMSRRRRAHGVEDDGIYDEYGILDDLVENAAVVGAVEALSDDVATAHSSLSNDELREHDERVRREEQERAVEREIRDNADFAQPERAPVRETPSYVAPEPTPMAEPTPRSEPTPSYDPPSRSYSSGYSSGGGSFGGGGSSSGYDSGGDSGGSDASSNDD